MTITHEDVLNIFRIIDGAEHLQEIDIAYGDFRLYARRSRESCEAAATAPLAKVAAGAHAAAEPIRASTPDPAADPVRARNIVPENMIAVRAPMLGTFYRAPAPGQKPFVEVGQQVSAGDTVCLVEVMKLFNSVAAGADGRIARILVENGALVQPKQVVILIDPN